MTNEYSICVTPVECLEANNGHAGFVDCLFPVSGMQQVIETILDFSPIDSSGEWVIIDHGGFGELELNSEDSLETIHEIAVLLSQNEEEMVVSLIDHYGKNHLDKVRSALKECSTTWKDMGDFAQSEVEDMDIPQFIKDCINYEKLGEKYEYDYQPIPMRGGNIMVVRR